MCTLLLTVFVILNFAMFSLRATTLIRLNLSATGRQTDKRTYSALAWRRARPIKLLKRIRKLLSGWQDRAVWIRL